MFRATFVLFLSLLLLGMVAACGEEEKAAPTVAPSVATPTSIPAAIPTQVLPVATPTSGTVTAKGTVEVRVTDAPPEGVSKVLITASKIEAQMTGAEGESGWTTIVESPPTFDLVAVTGLEQVLGSSVLSEGTYTQVRMSVTKVVVTVKGEDKSAEVPSDKLRVVGNFTVSADMTTVLTLDFDADKSVVLAGPNVQFKPVVKLLTQAPKDKPGLPKGAVVVPMGELTSSGQTGETTLTSQGSKTEVVINIKGGAAGVSQPAHVHDKDCTTPGAVKYPLTAIVDGKSTTVIDVPLATLQASAFAVRVHKSGAEAAIYVACGEVPMKVKVTMNALSDSGQTGETTLTSQGSKTEVVINIKGGAAGVSQPAHVHDKDCTTPGAVKYPLTAIVDGKSTTVIDVPLATLQASAFAVRVHKSGAEAAIYVACGIVSTGTQASSGTGGGQTVVAGTPQPPIEY